MNVDLIHQIHKICIMVTIKLYFLPSVKNEILCDSIAATGRLFVNKNVSNLTCELVVVLPITDVDGSTTDVPVDARLKEILGAWRQIKASSPGTQLQAWHVIYKYGDEIAPNLRVFRLRDSNSLCLFWLSSCQDFIEMQSRLADLLPTISAYWHITQDQGLFHAAGILHNGKACLFIGASGAGKSTVSSLSSAQGDKVIHDDHVVVYRGKTREWLVSDTSHSFQGIPITTILFLVQDLTNQLIPITTARTVKGLMKSLHEHGKYVLFGDVLRRAFTTSARIARRIPAFELHFRKSLDFWKLIDEQFPD